MTDTTVIWEAMKGPQLALVCCPVFEVFYGGARGGGKGLQPDAGVLTPFGFRRIGDLQVGSAISATDGTVQHIIGYYRRGVQPLYRLSWSDGTQTVCDADHIWLGHWSNRSKKRGNARLSGAAASRKITTAQLAAANREGIRFGIPVMSAPAAFNVHGENRGRTRHVGRSIPPYVLGVLLGDGSVGGGEGLFCSADPEIPARVAELLDCSISEYKTDGPCSGYRIPSAIIKADLAELGIAGHGAETKSVPRIYKLAPEAERWELLRGLMDTDGWAEADGDCYFSSISWQLADDVRFVARSLGAIVHWREKTPHFTHNGERKEGQRSYTVRIKIPRPERLFTLERKAALCRGKEPQSMAIWLERIEEAGEGETICIAVSHPNSLFVTDGFIVTHNTDGVLGEWLSHADKYGADAIGLMVRRERTQLIETIERSRMLYAPLGAKYHEQDKMWRFPNGARLRFAYLESDSDADAYQGHSYTRVYVEEVGTFPRPEPVLKLMATLRSGAGVPVGFRATGNPGGPGHNWVRARYIDPAPLGWKVGNRSFTNPFTGAAVSRDWVYIPSRLTDNHYLGDQYVANLYMSGSPALVRAWLEGDWSAIEGAFFDCWSPAKHVVRPFAIPDDWLRFRSMDWGSAAPFSVGWWAVVGDDAKIEGQVLPRGALVRYREWYGKGGKLTAEEVAQGIIERERSDAHLIKYGVLDPSAFAQDGGPSIAERMHATGRRLSSPLLFRPADNKRVTARGAMGGWDQMRSRLKGGPDGRPMLVTFSTCPDFIRTIPVLQHDPDKPEDLQTSSEDHAADEARYACMSRPWIAEPAGAKEPRPMMVGAGNRATLNDAWAAGEADRQRSHRI